MPHQLLPLIKALSAHYGPPRTLAPKDPFQLLLWEYVAYLADEPTRAAAFDELKRRVGLRPRDVAAASTTDLTAIARLGGPIGVAVRVKRMRDVASNVLDGWRGSLKTVLRLPYPEARRVLMNFPSIGPPGADKILLLTGSRPILALDSNALRVLLRLGFGHEHKSYAATYASAQTAAMAALPRTIPALRTASLLLQQHGQQLCKRRAPRCPICALRASCAFARNPIP